MFVVWDGLFLFIRSRQKFILVFGDCLLFVKIFLRLCYVNWDALSGIQQFYFSPSGERFNSKVWVCRHLGIDPKTTGGSPQPNTPCVQSNSSVVGSNISTEVSKLRTPTKTASPKLKPVAQSQSTPERSLVQSGGGNYLPGKVAFCWTRKRQLGKFYIKTIFTGLELVIFVANVIVGLFWEGSSRWITPRMDQGNQNSKNMQ